MHRRDNPEDEESYLETCFDPASPDIVSPPAPTKMTRIRRGQLIASRELLTAFLPGKYLYLGMHEPYQFVETSTTGSIDLHLVSCPCQLHQGREGMHSLNTSEVTLVLECGPDRVWAFISIPAHYHSRYTWLPLVGFGPHVDAELCGIVVANCPD